jgi:hypothetical protein
MSFDDQTNGFTLSCNGDMSLIGGSIDSDTVIAISALGALRLDNLTISAPLVEINTFAGELTFGTGVSIISTDRIKIDSGYATPPRIILEPGITLTLPGRTLEAGSTGGTITLAPGGDLSLGNGGRLTLVSTVPEADRYWSMLCGSLLLLVIGRTRLKHRV